MSFASDLFEYVSSFSIRELGRGPKSELVKKFEPLRDSLVLLSPLNLLSTDSLMLSLALVQLAIEKDFAL